MWIYLIERQINMSIKTNKEFNFNDCYKDILPHKDSTLYKFEDFNCFLLF